MGYGGHTNQKKGLALNNIDKLARYQSMPDDAMNEISSARTTNKKALNKMTKLKSQNELPVREKNKSAEKLKKNVVGENFLIPSRGKGSGARV